MIPFALIQQRPQIQVMGGIELPTDAHTLAPQYLLRLLREFDRVLHRKQKNAAYPEAKMTLAVSSGS
jgi:hypothetical protein